MIWHYLDTFNLSNLSTNPIYCREIVPCFDHASCDTDLKCTNGVCGDMEYLKALGDMQCEDDDLCEVRVGLCICLKLYLLLAGPLAR